MTTFQTGDKVRVTYKGEIVWASIGLYVHDPHINRTTLVDPTYVTFLSRGVPIWVDEIGTLVRCGPRGAYYKRVQMGWVDVVGIHVTKLSWDELTGLYGADNIVRMVPDATA